MGDPDDEILTQEYIGEPSTTEKMEENGEMSQIISTNGIILPSEPETAISTSIHSPGVKTAEGNVQGDNDWTGDDGWE